MSEAISFDTHRFVKNLTEHGFTEEQAETLAMEQVALLNSNLATKEDIEKLRLATKADIEKLRLATKADIKELRAATKADIEKLRLATKADIEKLRLETKADIENLRLATETKIEAIKSEMLKWMFGAMAAQTGVIVAVIKLF